MRTSLITFVWVAVLAPAVAHADDESTKAVAKADVALQTGIVLPQLGSKLGTNLGVKLDVGFVIVQRLSALLAVSYTQPGIDHTQMDPRVAGGSYNSSTTQRELAITVGARWRFRAPSESLNAYAGAGAKVYFLQTLANGAAGAPVFLENRERSTRFGAAVFAGGELKLGPGAACAELELAGSALPHVATGDVQTTALSLIIGYRWFIK